MAERRAQDVLRHSVLDRLVSAPGAGGRRGDLRISVEDLKLAVRRDIEWLLNTRRSSLPGLAGLPEAQASLLTYGMPDLTMFTRGEGDRRRICELIEEALRAFEPRLLARSIRVEALADGGEPRSHLRFAIHAELHVDPIREPVTFDTSVEMVSGAVAVAAGD